MWYLNVLLNTLCDAMLWPFQGESPWPAMIAVSLVTGLIFIGVFLAFSDQRALKRKKGRMFARALELLLFRHEMLVSVTAFPRIATANGSYLKELLKPVALALVPSVLLLVQLACWYEYRPFSIGDTVLVDVELTSDAEVMSRDITLKTSDALVVETEALRIPSLSQHSWRLQARADGNAWVDVTVDDTTVRKEVIVDQGMQKISVSRVGASLWEQMLHPCEPPLTDDALIAKISVHYPHRDLELAGYSIPWIIAFLILTMIFGLIFGRMMKVSF
ncbi:MAG: hypothetical protein KDA93_25970 [Planctomycetaceae bacterium]|nr:hypothetical protein [Planctomycetaceae bacterium]